MSSYAYTAGRGSVMHLTQYDRGGNQLPTTFCGRTYNRTINVPLGRRTCKICARKYTGR
jgi:hypothetical protein